MVVSEVYKVNSGVPNWALTTVTVTSLGLAYDIALVPERVQDKIADGISGSLVPVTVTPVTTN